MRSVTSSLLLLLALAIPASGAWVLSPAFVAQSAQLEKTVVFSSEARQEAADAALGVAVDPARLGRGGRYVDPDVAQQFAWTFFQG